MKKKTGRRGVPDREAAYPLHPMPDCTVLEAAALMRCSPSTVYRLINAGEIDAYKRGDRTLIDGESILALKERNRIKPGEFPEAVA
ncbi:MULTISPECIES: helix-turn-helix domain-containing protein [Ruegeria]|uniref:helix-turn-helix domain-containing protein n=1 Tax=Ruegeria TaxID=97050 RepID=UPI00147BE5AE|nr:MULTISPECIES: helix-turn-helix domain-containing protein [Ruegeria]MCA0927102.1 helix-turn-helix domain-containing protein [Ruegeria profundi]